MDNSEQLKKLTRIFNTEKIVTVEDISEVLKGVLGIMTKFKKENQELTQETKEVVKDLLQQSVIENQKLRSDVSGETSQHKQDIAVQFDTKLKEIKQLMREFSVVKPKDGKNADEEVIVDKVLAKIKLPEQKEILLDDRLKIVKKINTGEKKDLKIELKQIEDFDKLEKEITARALSILDQRTQFLINKTVKHDNTLTGEGTDANPLSVVGGGGGLSTVSHDATLTGDGTVGNPLGVVAGGSGTVTSVSVATANGVSGSVANPTTTPDITLTLGAITPTSVAASGTITGSNLSGTNTGDNTNFAPPLGADDNYVTDAQLVVIANTSGVNTGDNTNFAPPLGADDNYATDAEKVKLANLSGTNTGDQTLAGLGGANTTLSNLGTTAINASLIGAVAGGISIFGGVAANDDLILQGTSHATKTTSYVNLQPTGGFVGIGTATPGAKLDLRDGNFLLTDTDVAHGVTSYLPTNAYAVMQANSATAGGMLFFGASDADVTGIYMFGIIGATNPADGTPAVYFDGCKANGATIQAMAPLETVFRLDTGGTGLLTVLGNGNVGMGVMNPGARLHIVQAPLTGASVAYLYHTVTWNNAATTFTGLYSDVTNTASVATSLLFDFRVNGATRLSLDVQGNLNTQQINTAGSVYVGSTNWFGFNNRSLFASSADGIMTISNYATTSFNRLNFGGNTSSFPSIRRTTTALNFRLADDSADAGITALSLLLSAPGTGATDVPTLGSTNTLTNKRITQRVVTTADDSTAVIDVDVTDQYQLTAMANATTISTTGTPTAGQILRIRLKDNGTARALTWDAVFRVVGVTLPTTTVISKTVYIGCIYNLTDTKWDAVAVSQEA